MIERKQVGATEDYRGYTLSVRYMGPDLLAYVGVIELSGFYLNREAALAAARRYVDDDIKAREKRK